MNNEQLCECGCPEHCHNFVTGKGVCHTCTKCKGFQPATKPSEEHATVKVDGYTIPLIGIKKSETDEVCEYCNKPTHMQNGAFNTDGKYICNDCHSKFKGGDEICHHTSQNTVVSPAPKATEQVGANYSQVICGCCKQPMDLQKSTSCCSTCATIITAEIDPITVRDKRIQQLEDRVKELESK